MNSTRRLLLRKSYESLGWARDQAQTEALRARGGMIHSTIRDSPDGSLPAQVNDP